MQISTAKYDGKRMSLAAKNIDWPCCPSPSLSLYPHDYTVVQFKSLHDKLWSEARTYHLRRFERLGSLVRAGDRMIYLQCAVALPPNGRGTIRLYYSFLTGTLPEIVTTGHR